MGCSPAVTSFLCKVLQLETSLYPIDAYEESTSVEALTVPLSRIYMHEHVGSATGAHCFSANHERSQTSTTAHPMTACQLLYDRPPRRAF